MKQLFNERGDFKAMYAAEKWCEANGYSVGSTERGSPRCLVRGDWVVAKWRNLTAAERLECHGVMTGDMRNGPVTVEVFAEVAAEQKGP